MSGAAIANEGRIEGWKAIAERLGVSESRARQLADPRRKFQLPVRFGVRGVYIMSDVLVVWFQHFDAPYGLHGELKRHPDSEKKSAARRSSALRALRANETDNDDE